jgi:hypothetical protein
MRERKEGKYKNGYPVDDPAPLQETQSSSIRSFFSMYKSILNIDIIKLYNLRKKIVFITDFFQYKCKEGIFLTSE